MHTLFHHLAFKPVDPLGDGLGDDIAAEQAEPEAMVLEEQLDGTLAEQWEEILEEARSDPEYFDVINPSDEL